MNYCFDEEKKNIFRISGEIITVTVQILDSLTLSNEQRALIKQYKLVSIWNPMQNITYILRGCHHEKCSAQWPSKNKINYDDHDKKAYAQIVILKSLEI